MAERSETWHMDMKGLLALALERGASDLHLKAGRPPILRVDGHIHYADLATLRAADVLELARQIMDERVHQQFQEVGSVDFAHATESGDRFRVNVYRQRGHTSVAVRRVSRTIRSFEQLHLPGKTLERICEAREGLVIFSGVTGTGKSTSIASCLDYVNSRRPCHIVTLEDPIEYLFEDQKAFINQREIGTDVPSYEMALRSLLREDPDVVLVGEMRAREDVEGVLRAAETTRLVFTTVHASSVPGVITRILDLFQIHDHHVVRESLAHSLVAIICQKLVPAADPNVARLPATEIMLATPVVRKAIRDGEEAHLSGVIAAGGDLGMHDFTQDLARLVREEWVDPRMAYEAAPNPEALKMAIRGIDVKRGTLR
ncbi:MAG TPA: PilT/PilU family type 4a pilus ATPase [Phycisphaerae bacterium]|nr:PilT/PilU family type 4a pilus ATPase [Phycisphaerae bacterium]